jgi:signal transduction histidine kinase
VRQKHVVAIGEDGAAAPRCSIPSSVGVAAAGGDEPGPALAWSSPAGWSVTVLESSRPAEAARASFRRQTWSWIALAATVAIAASLALSAWLTRPIARLERVAEELAAGNFEATAGLARSDEIGRLGAAFDRMAGALHELDRAKSEFVANVSHELRTPLTSLQLSVANLVDGVVGELDPKQRSTLLRIQGELGRLIRLVNQLLEMARLDAGAVLLNGERIELAELAREVAVSLEPLAGEHAVKIEIEGDGSVLADRSMLQRVLVNLLDNAIKYSPSRGTVRIVIGPDGFRVQDQGPGIDTSFAFEAFRQGQQHGVKNPGAGLGLAIVRRLVELNEGSIRVESGAGAGLVVELPRA